MCFVGGIHQFHDDVIKWKRFQRYWPFVRRIHRSPVNSPQKGQWRGALMFSLICAWTNGLPNNREAGDLRRHCAHYDATVELTILFSWVSLALGQLYDYYGITGLYGKSSMIPTYINRSLFNLVVKKQTAMIGYQCDFSAQFRTDLTLIMAVTTMAAHQVITLIRFINQMIPRYRCFPPPLISKNKP